MDTMYSGPVGPGGILSYRGIPDEAPVDFTLCNNATYPVFIKVERQCFKMKTDCLVPITNDPSPEAPGDKEDKMSRYYDECSDCYVDGPTSEEVIKRSYLLGRASAVFQEKAGELNRKFGFGVDHRPETFNEFLERVKEGKYHFDNDDANCSNWFYRIHWRDPDIKYDHKGLTAAMEVLQAFSQKVEDAVRLKSTEEGLKAVEDFENWKYKK
jgi:hypothetical protein